MTKKFIVLLLILISSNCSIEKKLKEPIHIFYSDSDIEAEVILNKKMAKSHGEKNRYYYYGVMKYRIISELPEKILFVSYENKESKIYLDTIASVVDTWYYRSHNSKNLEENKVYVVFDESELNWRDVRIKTRNAPEDISHYCLNKKSEVCNRINTELIKTH